MAILLVTPPDIEAYWHAGLARAMPQETIFTPREGFDRAAIDIAVVANPPPGQLSNLPNLAFIQSLWAGVDKLLNDETLPPVPLYRLVDPHLARAMAEAVAAAVLFAHRQFYYYVYLQRERRWDPFPVKYARNRPVTVLGLGEMGQAALALLAPLGFPLRGWSRTPKTIAGVKTFAGADGWRDAIEGAEILVNLLPLTPDTRGILNRESLAPLAGDACLINFGRGAHLVEKDLLWMLDHGPLAFAFLDVFAQEPLPPDHPFWTHDQIFITPHIAAPTDRDSACALVAQAVAHYRATGAPPERGRVDRARGY